MPPRFLREGTYDSEILKEIKPSYGWMEVRGKTVLDIGACFGAATVYFAEHGAEHVIAVEPVPDNLRMLRKNVRALPVTVLPYAVSDSPGLVDLYLSQGNTGAHSLHVTRGRESITVATIEFQKLLRGYKPDAIKIDCEGAEYDFLTQPLPNYVRQVAMEIHLNKKRWREEFSRIVKLFEGWEVVKEPRLTEANWHTLGGWRR